MRKLFAQLIIIVAIAALATVGVVEAREGLWFAEAHITVFTGKIGDVNGDGIVDTGDITKVKRIYFGLDLTTPGADVNGDGFIDTGDITAIKVIYFEP